MQEPSASEDTCSGTFLNPVRLPWQEEPAIVHAAQNKHLTTATLQPPDARSIPTRDRPRQTPSFTQSEAGATRLKKALSAPHLHQSQLIARSLRYLTSSTHRSSTCESISFVLTTRGTALGKRCCALTFTRALEPTLSRLSHALRAYASHIVLSPDSLLFYYRLRDRHRLEHAVEIVGPGFGVRRYKDSARNSSKAYQNT